MNCDNCGFGAWVEPDHSGEEMEREGYNPNRYCPSCGARQNGDGSGK